MKLLVVMSKQSGNFFQIFMAFSEYLNMILVDIYIFSQ